MRGEPVVERAAARVVCLDGRDRILLLAWRDPVDGRLVWEPPGGGIEPGESPIEAARRELEEETGLPGHLVTERSLAVPRDWTWAGVRHRGTETFFLAIVDRPERVGRDRLLPEEAAVLEGHRWVESAALEELPGVLEPPALRDILRRLVPAGPWHDPSAAPGP